MDILAFILISFNSNAKLTTF